MCIAIPKTKDGNTKREPAWKSLLLFLPRLLGLVWLFLRMMAAGASAWLRDHGISP